MESPCPWRLDSSGKPPNIEVVVEVEAALGMVLGAAILWPAEGFRGAAAVVDKQEAGGLIGEGSRTSTVGIYHQVHLVEAAEDVNGSMLREELMHQVTQGRRGKLSGYKMVVEEVRDEGGGSCGEMRMWRSLLHQQTKSQGGQVGAEEAVAERKRESDMCFEKRQMVWNGVTGSC